MKEVRAIAHGRVNLIGEHTDYNGGFVLPTCIPQFTEVNLRARADKKVVARSQGFSDTVEFTIGEERPRHHWGDFVQGVTSILSRDGHYLGGFEADFRSNVPVGSGLSSSAAFEVSLMKGLDELFGLGLDPVRVAQYGQLVENDFVGARVGIMDQMICSLGTVGEALFIDTRDLTVLKLPLPVNEMELVVINSGVTHSHAHGGYNQRRAECEEACKILGVNQLRDLGTHDLPRLKELPEVLHRRAHHVVSENARVLDAVSALQAHDFQKLGRLFIESHKSMRNDYEVSVPEIDLLVDLVMSEANVFGARLTGGGFGGSIVALAQVGHAATVADRVCEEYRRRTQREPKTLVAGL